MGVAVLHPQDPFRNRPSNHYQSTISHFPNMKLPNPNPNPKFHRSSRNRKKRTDSGPQDLFDPTRPTSTKPHVNNKQQLVIGQVKILRRGEQLTETKLDPQVQKEAVCPTLPLTEMKVVCPTLPLTETKVVCPTLPLTETKVVSPMLPLTETKVVSPTLPLTETKDVSPMLSLTEKMEGLYAGYSILVMSPPPSSVPLPIFITKKIAAVSDATSDLRKMLRLDFP